MNILQHIKKKLFYDFATFCHANALLDLGNQPIGGFLPRRFGRISLGSLPPAQAELCRAAPALRWRQRARRFWRKIQETWKRCWEQLLCLKSYEIKRLKWLPLEAVWDSQMFASLWKKYFWDAPAPETGCCWNLQSSSDVLDGRGPCRDISNLQHSTRPNLKTTFIGQEHFKKYTKTQCAFIVSVHEVVVFFYFPWEYLRFMQKCSVQCPARRSLTNTLLEREHHTLVTPMSNKPPIKILRQRSPTDEEMYEDVRRCTKPSNQFSSTTHSSSLLKIQLLPPSLRSVTFQVCHNQAEWLYRPCGVGGSSLSMKPNERGKWGDHLKHCHSWVAKDLKVASLAGLMISMWWTSVKDARVTRTLQFTQHSASKMKHVHRRQKLRERQRNLTNESLRGAVGTSCCFFSVFQNMSSFSRFFLAFWNGDATPGLPSAMLQILRTFTWTAWTVEKIPQSTWPLAAVIGFWHK